jgi:hypothetical protein
VISIPGGLGAGLAQLKEMVKRGTVSHYETNRRSLVFYWKHLKENEVKELRVALIALVPGKYTSAASRAYLYCADEHQSWESGTTVEISPRQTAVNKR